MADVKAFISEIYDIVEKNGYCVEDDQQFPGQDILEKVCSVLLDASTMREEGRYSSFRVCFIEPGSVFLDVYIYSHAVLFDEPIAFNTKELHRLAPAMSADISYMLLDITGEQIKIVGILAGYTTWEKIRTKEIEIGNRLPKIPNLLVNGPGELKACYGETPIVSLQWGNLIHYRTDTFTSTLIAQILREGSSVSDDDRLKFLYKVIRNTLEYGHGAHIYIIPAKNAAMSNTRIKYNLRCNFMFADNSDSSLRKLNDKDIATYADMISKFTTVDGAVVLTKELDLLGFGAETLVDVVGSKEPDMCFIDYDGTENTTKKYYDNGMRHRACYSFCNSYEGAVALIISHDGFVKACTKHNGRVVVYDSVSLPVM